MKAKVILSIAFTLILSTTFSQNGLNPCDLLTELPNNLELDKAVQEKYLMITDYFDFDMFGNFRNKTRISAQFTKGLENGFVKWNNVLISKWDHSKNKLGEEKKQEIMENFSYVPSSEMLNPESFPNFPPNSTQLQNLVWDMIGFEVFAWEYFDSLNLNKELEAKDINSEVDLAGSGTFENKDIRLTWTGITKMNNEICAIVEFTAMNNPLKVKNDFIDIKGRSHYWGKVYVSLEDKQIEYADMLEDVIMEIVFAGQEQVKSLNTTRKITLGKLQ